MTKKLNNLVLGLTILSGGIFCNQTNQSYQETKNLEDKVVYETFEKDTMENGKNFNLSGDYKFSYEDLKKFDEHVNWTIKDSKENNKNSIIIDKSEYTLYLIKAGEVDSKFPIELGSNPFEDKFLRGDGCTPEGIYNISWKRDIGQTIFYRAFLLNYPNEEDKTKNKTGSHVEIHGNGSGKSGNKDGSNWTLGCIALSNEDIDLIFPYINDRDKVTIVRYTSKL